jgi:hypothetical protein
MTRFALSVALVCVAAAAAAADHYLKEDEVINVPPNTKVVGVSWESDDVSVFVRPMTPDDAAEEWRFSRSSGTGLGVETIIVRERRLGDQDRPSITTSLED